MNKYSKCHIVAEAGCNHLGNFDIAKKMVKSIKLAGADFVKFQKRKPELAVPKCIQNKPHPCPVHAFGETYLEHRKFLELTIEQHAELADMCGILNIGYSCSVWDEVSAREIISLEPAYIKVPSPINNNFNLLDILFNEYEGNIHISLGMTTEKEKKDLFNYIDPFKERCIVYWTTSDYPVRFKELFLLEIKKLINIFPHVGYSGHNLGIAVDIAAYTLGCSWIERHFTLDRTWKGTDQAASLEPLGLQKLCRDLKAVQKALAFKNVEMTDGEMKNREKLKFRLSI